MDSLPAPFDGLSDLERGILLEAVDGSDFSLADWIRALETFDRWLGGRDEVRRPWTDMIGYIECCTRMTAPGLSSPDLAGLTERALDDFGFSVLAEFQE